MLSFTTLADKEVCRSSLTPYSELTSCTSEFNDESFIVPRSTSLVAKRVPARQGARKPAPQQTTSSSVGDTTGTSSQPAYLRGRGAMSKRFDGKDDALKSQASVSPVLRLAMITSRLMNYSSQLQQIKLLHHLKARLVMKQPPWQPCSKPKQTCGRKRKKRCLSQYWTSRRQFKCS